MTHSIPGFAKLQQFEGGIASLWFFAATHTQLVIRLARPGTEAQAFIVVYGCSRIEASAAWVFRLPQVRSTEDGQVELVDCEGGFRLVCESASVEDAYEIFRPR